MDLHVSYVTGTDDIKAASLFVGRRGSILRKAMTSGRRRMLMATSGLIVVMLVVMIMTTPPPTNATPPGSASPVSLLHSRSLLALCCSSWP